MHFVRWEDTRSLTFIVKNRHIRHRNPRVFPANLMVSSLCNLVGRSRKKTMSGRVHKSFAPERVVSPPTAPTEPGDLLETQIPGPPHRLTKSETLVVDVQKSGLSTSPPQVIVMCT